MKTLSHIAAAFILGCMFLLMFLSSWNDAAIFDETAHIGAAYSYITLRDMRLNPEHPPLLKDLAGIALLPLHAVFRTDTTAWQNDVNGQWAQGGAFLYEFGNDPDRILHYARFPLMLIALLFGWLLYRWVLSVYGTKTALLALFFYASSPTIIAHSRFVTTDIGAAFAFFIGITTYVRFLARPSTKRLAVAGIAFGIAQNIKFSLFLLVPIYVFLGLVSLFVRDDIWDVVRTRKERARLLWRHGVVLGLKTLAIFLVGVVIIWIVYLWHVWNYPQEKQLSDAQTLIRTFRVKPLVTLDLWLISHAPTRPLGQYLLGLMMVTQRTAGGNSAYFLGEVSANGWWYYFPTAYALKETLAFHLLTLIALVLAIRRVLGSKEKTLRAVREWIHDNFAYFASIFFVAFYWASSIANPLNIGVRHVIPTFPFIYLLVSRQLVLWMSEFRTPSDGSLRGLMSALYHTVVRPIPRVFLVALLCLWAGLSTLFVFPYYLSYFNEIVGTQNGYKYITDSNYDWGQDLKRLGDHITRTSSYEPVYLDYFGGGSPKYYLGRPYQPWYSSYGPPPSGSLFAVSANSIQGNQARYIGNLSIKPEDTYPWLRDLKPFDRAGTSIFLYRMP